MSLIRLGLSKRALTVLFRYHIETVEDLLPLCDKDLSKMRGMGATTLQEIKHKLVIFHGYSANSEERVNGHTK